MKTGSALSFYSTGVSDPPLTEQKNVAFMGTLVSSGRGRGLVVSVGSHTEFGKIANDLKKVESRKSPLQVKIDELGKLLAYGSSIVIALIGMLGWILGRPLLETVTVAVSLAVAAIPEGLPICVTVTLALGVLKMARSNAIVKKLTSVETLGCATVVASDKTGTLTQNEMTARSVFTLAFPQLSFSLTGVGYNPNDGYLVQKKSLGLNQNVSTENEQRVAETSLEFGAIQALFAVASISNNATMSNSDKDNSEMMLSGQPTELALLVGAAKAKVPDPRPQYHRLQEIPFTSDRKRMEVRARPVSGQHISPAFSQAVVNSSSDGSLYFVKGMPESILGDCKTHIAADSSAAPLSEKDRNRVLVQSRRMASGGLRVLAMAYGTDLENLTFAGIVGMEDPPRKGVAEAVEQLQRGGISVLMVTGDSKETAIAIAKKCGIIQPSQFAPSFGEDSDNDNSPPSSNNLFDVEFGAGLALSGKELDAIPPPLLAESIIGIKIFYRVAPRHKLALVRAYQSQGEIVAMTGDGVNDAIALKVSLTYYLFRLYSDRIC
jgi:Ca2+-transporting ATPase